MFFFVLFSPAWKTKQEKRERKKNKRKNKLHKDSEVYTTTFLGRTNIDSAPITRNDLESSDITSSDEDRISESEKDIVVNNNALSADSSLSDVNDGYDKENEHTAEQLFTITVQAEQQQHINEQNICIDIPYGMYCQICA